jgi:glycine cleavage system transcriptional repressor
MQQHLVVSITGTNQPNTLNELCKLIAHYGCSIITSRTNVLGTEFSSNLLLVGTWDALAKLETALPKFEKKFELRCIARRTQLPTPPLDEFPYSVYITAQEHSSTAHKITQFFAEQHIRVHELFINYYKTPISEIMMLSISLLITLPTKDSIADIRENFMLFCDDHNFDAVMEPVKG